MKIRAAVNAGAALVLPLASALQKAERNPEDDRGLFEFTVVFDECVGKQLEECKSIIQAAVESQPEIFEYRPSLDYDVSKVREGSDPHYYLVGLRTNLKETGVTGILGDGMVFYPWDWCVTAEDCYTLGPWDCDIGTPLTVEQCCEMIQATVPAPDLNGNILDCYADYPVGSVSNPIDYGRVTIHVDSTDKVVHPPRNE